MGCVSSKIARKKEFKRESQFGNPNVSNHHVVSLTSSTYGLLRLDHEDCVKKPPPPEEDQAAAEVINAWELMEGLDESAEPPSVVVQSRKSPKSRVLVDYRKRSPLKLFNQIGSPKTFNKRFGGGKENSPTPGRANSGKTESSPKTVVPKLYRWSERVSGKGSPDAARAQSRAAARSLFDPEMPAVSRKSSDEVIRKFQRICPPGGENAVVIYTTTLRGIRKTFEDCNAARSVLRSHEVRVYERDVSMHSGFKEEVRALMGTNEVRVPLVFVKGMLIGGADEISKLEEEGTLGNLLEGIPRAVGGGCRGCGGVRFLLCRGCSGSCKVLGEDGKSSVKCGECNENGLILCPICC
ncbi:hypothetical protein DM860_001090 [Cuscuta australis]|uniref:Glutaredoxin domain-containing protein n=1 Tax=Cuscuta australis TaxID=267555 RepID=A0A328DU09_9ASTE|nr:hypothetical protein DM860_001090 [Cuscuta australis]